MTGSRRHPAGFRRQPRIADRMTPDLDACVDRSLAAERAGDVAAALEWHRAVPMFRGSRHTLLLEGLSRLGDDLPDWVWARWTAYQATRCEDGATGHLTRTALTGTIDAVHVDMVERCYREGRDPIRVVARVSGESWAYHQRAAHEAGALISFLDEHAAGRLAEHCDLARAWADTPMLGYELGESLPGSRLRVRPTNGRQWIEVLDVGARSCAPGGWVIGRLVPSANAGPLMFDLPPLAVPRTVARAVSGAADWFEVLADAVAAREVTGSSLLREDYPIATDVRELDLLRFGTEPRDLSRVMEQLRSGRDEVSRAAYRVLARAVTDEIGPEDQAYVAAAAQNVRANHDAHRRLVGGGRGTVWAAWADRVTAPSRRLLLDLAERG